MTTTPVLVSSCQQIFSTLLIHSLLINSPVSYRIYFLLTKHWILDPFIHLLSKIWIRTVTSSSATWCTSSSSAARNLFSHIIELKYKYFDLSCFSFWTLFVPNVRKIAPKGFSSVEVKNRLFTAFIGNNYNIAFFNFFLFFDHFGFFVLPFLILFYIIYNCANICILQVFGVPLPTDEFTSNTYIMIVMSDPQIRTSSLFLYKCLYDSLNISSHNLINVWLIST